MNERGNSNAASPGGNRVNALHASAGSSSRDICLLRRVSRGGECRVRGERLRLRGCRLDVARLRDLDTSAGDDGPAGAERPRGRLGGRRRARRGAERDGRVAPGRLQRLSRQRLQQPLLRGRAAASGTALLRSRVRASARHDEQGRGRGAGGPARLVACLGRRQSGRRPGVSARQSRCLAAAGDDRDVGRGRARL